MEMTLLLPLVGFIFISLLVVGGAMALSPGGGTTALARRLGEVSAARTDQADEPPPDRSVIQALKRMGAMAPRSLKEQGKLQQRLVVAGYRGREAMVVFFGIRLGVAVLFFVLAATPVFIGRPNLAMALAVCAVGYVLPSMVLARIAKRRQHRMRLGLADALDLLVVSVEAGLGLDQALQRVSDELMFAHPELCEELRLINLELRAGTARSEALHNLARRTQLDDIASLVTMLVQTDKFGTSVAQSLRVHSETLRTKRRQRAEEAAAKTGAKMVFPLVICIFPAIWVVTLGPAIIKFVQVLLPMAH
jgi:tight adherence protein C